MAQKDPKSIQLTYRLTEFEREIIEQAAKEVNRTVADFVRLAAYNRAEELIRRVPFLGNNGPELKAGHFLYRHFNKDGILLYVGESADAIKRLIEHRSGSPWFEAIFTVTIERFATRTEALAAEQKAIETEHPRYNKPKFPRHEWSKPARRRTKISP